MNVPAVSRRRFLVHAALAVAAALLAPLVVGRADAQALTPLPADHPTAKALAYSTQEVAAKHPSYKPGSACDNCQFFAPATNGCSLFPGFAVKPKAWCSAWAKKA